MLQWMPRMASSPLPKTCSPGAMPGMCPTMASLEGCLNCLNATMSGFLCRQIPPFLQGSTIHYRMSSCKWCHPSGERKACRSPAIFLGITQGTESLSLCFWVIPQKGHSNICGNFPCRAEDMLHRPDLQKLAPSLASCTSPGARSRCQSLLFVEQTQLAGCQL